MRLTKLKLAGFKSFVDPTTVLVPGQLVGVVGPNGCGKSNIIDAVRWVLGESKATALRGESMQDVIFNGSGSRKPVGRASVELVFDNALGRAAGQWSQYAEIAVKRVLDRSGTSSYYLNNLQVRRRDVIDVFLGTGLGPRAYAIIEQGMISRIIEAKPEELRLFLEEAAGVTKYKERRRETAQRLGDARDNLLRVDDIRGELDGQVERLEVQAEVARRYHDLKSRHDRQQQLLWLKKRNDARSEHQRLLHEFEEGNLRLEAETTQLRTLEARVEEARSEHFASSDALHAAQAEMYTANAEVTRLETEIQHLRETRHKLEQRLLQLAAEEQHWNTQLVGLATEAERWQQLLENARLRAETSQARHEEAAERLPQAEDAVRSAGEAVSATRRAVHEAEQGLKLGEANRSHALRALENHAQRRARLDIERLQLGQPEPQRLAAALEAQEIADMRLIEHQEQLGELQAQLPQQEQQLRLAREAQQQAQRALAETRARHGALQQLQERVEKHGGAAQLTAWLSRLGLQEAPPLWRSLSVAPGWETAVEAVLRERLTALSADDMLCQRVLDEPPPALLALLRQDATQAGVARPQPAPALPPDFAGPSPVSLRSQISCQHAGISAVLDDWLAGVYCVESLQPCLEAAVPHGVCYVHAEGHQLTAHGLVMYVPDARTHGVIERQRELDELALLLEQRLETAELAQEAQQQAEAALQEAQAGLAGARQRLQEAQAEAHQAQVAALKLAEAQTRYEERAAQLARDLAEISAAEEHERLGMLRAEEEGADSREQLELARARLDEALAILARHEQTLREARAQEQTLAREAQELGFTERECTGKLADNARAHEQAQQQLARITDQHAQASMELANISDDSLQDRLQAALNARQQDEGRLAQRRDALEAAAAHLRALDEQRLRIEQGLEPLRQRLGEIQLKHQAAALNAEQYQQRLQEAHPLSAADEAALEAELDLAPQMRESQMSAQITRLQQEIEALGSVNLAALEELESARQRKGFLDEQSDDLNRAINTLEDAIRRIDAETREQLQQTYDTVNHHFGTLFPQLFGGGEARLIMTGEEILDSGVQVMAQPPGKKNSSIHLLSGGEKALTATALVFAMFQLNPAPFCLLDEVDAPLDDSNTERFCNMVRRMSAQTQFLFISHNKIAMEMAEQLVGVTMQEQGVSRVVEVDMEEALRMTEAATGGGQ